MLGFKKPKKRQDVGCGVTAILSAIPHNINNKKEEHKVCNRPLA